MTNDTNRLGKKAKTAATSGFAVGGGKTELLQVKEGIPASDALDMASVMLAAALPIIYDAAHDLDSNKAHGACYLVETAKGILDSVAVGLNQPG